MAIFIITEGITKLIPSGWLFSFAGFIIGLTLLRAWTSGRTNTRDRDLHGRLVLVTGGFTATGLEIMLELAKRGAQIVALVPDLSDPLVQVLIQLIQQTTGNELVFAEKCDMTSPASMRQFHETFVKGRTGTGIEAEPPRIDAVMFCHEYTHIGVWDRLGRSKAQRLEEEDRRRKNAYGTYFFSTLFLPFLLRSPPERDIRFINVVNPMYAAAVSQFEPKGVAGVAASLSTSVTQLESERSLRSILFARHFQRVLDAMVNPPVPPTSQDSTQIPITLKKQSNIKFVTACPGFGLEESIAPFLGATRDEAGVLQSRLGRALYFIFWPLLFFVSKSAAATSQTPLYTLCVPHHSRLPKPSAEAVPTAEPQSSSPSSNASAKPKRSQEPEPVLAGGGLYRECDMVQLPSERGKRLMEEESVGRAVWEWLEAGVKAWEEEEKERLGTTDAKPGESGPSTTAAAETAQPEVDVDSTLPGLKGKFKAS
ncbi:hypothetical protein M407DRAFT_165707 [Tulasnella calospora MUT 4182]|uniref:Ketoreductase (KR) domain-containing protein n=1 Tax=Tulasnella calospora MUT 4182 TaxID=1051891 RepID=A0A0C3QW20_9AGAM|nr:hypothetical protein M407DRAFT_165707 [Tulasnella calospora MUT 4182]